MKRRRPYNPQFQRAIKSKRYYEDLGQIDHEAAVKAAAKRAAEASDAAPATSAPAANDETT